MSQTTTPTAITAVRDLKKERDAADFALVQGVVAWSVEFRVDKSVVDDLTFGVDGILLGGVGCPLVSEFDVYDLAAGLGMSSEAGCGYVGKVLELRYRLRKIWERVIALEVPVWKAFRVAEHTMNLNFEAAGHVDQMIAPVLHSCSFAQIERTVSQAVDLYDPEEAERLRLKAADDRSFDIHLGGASTEGTVDVTGTLALEDALDLEQAVKDGAKSLGELGCEESRDVRRSMAVGEMARNQLAFNLNGEDGDLTAGGGCRGVNLYAHLDPDGMHASLDNVGGNDVLIAQIKAWCEAVGNVVNIRPVIDLNTQLSTNAYTPTDTIVEQVRLRDQVCVFPNCTRRARFCDLDHRVPHAQDGKTCTGNLALLCRKHHRAKTFSAWTYDSPQPGVYDWTSPSGLRFQVVRGRRHGRMPITTLIEGEPEP
ncbi:hypothetical protein BH09ACT12_BH09ACT12_37230 [soil metagenome]